MPFRHNLACPHAGQWHLLFFRKKVNKKLPTTPFAKKEVLLLTSSVPQSSDVENKVNFGLYSGWIDGKPVTFRIILNASKPFI
nr:hypothetical protein [uncultured Pedobacter sp.]